MRGTHDPSRFRRAGSRRSPDARNQNRDAGSARRQRQLAAGDEIECTHLAPHVEHNGAERIAGDRVRRDPQRSLRVCRVHRHDAAGIEAELRETVHRQRAGFDVEKILPHP